MKKIVALLAAAVMLLMSAALAEDLSALTDDGLRSLLENVYDEMTGRGMDFDAETSRVQYGTAEDQEALSDRLEAFTLAWCEKRTDDMLALCDPAWTAQQEDPKAALEALTGKWTLDGPLEFNFIARETKNKWHVSVASDMDSHDGQKPMKMTYLIDMNRGDDGLWYVDPEFSVMADAAEENSTLLFYVPEGGEKYHLDQNCMAVAEKYKPMQGMLTYADLDSVAYKDLVPCAVCGAPARGLAGEDLEKAMTASAPADLPQEDWDAAAARLFQFFEHWQANRLDEMTEMCASDWKEKHEFPKTALFALLSNTAPVDSPELYYVYGSGNECAYMAAATVELHDGTTPRRFRYCLVLKREADGLWHIDPEGLDTAVEWPEETVQTEEAAAPETGAVMEPLLQFFLYWSRNSVDDMLPLCVSDWQAAEEDPRLALFVILANRTPLSITPETVDGKPGDGEVTVIATAEIDRNNGNGPAKYRLEILMKQEADGSWRVDPRSLAVKE